MYATRVAFVLCLTFAVFVNYARGQTIDQLIAAAKVYEVLQPDSAVSYCSRAMRLAQTHNNPAEEAAVLLALARISRLHHHTELARKFVNDAITIYYRLHQDDGLARAFEELGQLDGLQLKSMTASADFNRALTYYIGKSDTADIAQTYYDEGVTTENNGDLAKALGYYLQALHYFEKFEKRPAAYFMLLERIGQVYIKKGNRSAALQYLEAGVHNSSDRPDTEITLLEEEGKIKEGAAEHANALAIFKRELELAKRSNNPEAQAKALAAIGSVLMAQGTDSSLSYLKQALSIAQHLPHAELKASIYEAMASVYQQQRNYKDAMLALTENSRLLDSLLVSKTNSDIAALDSSYVIESQEEEVNKLKEINRLENVEIHWGLVALVVVIIALLLLWLYMQKIKRLNRKLAKSNQIRDTLFSIIGHDLKGPAGNTVQLMDLIQSGELPEALQKDMLRELREQAVASYDLLNDLFAWGKAQLHGVEVKPESFEPKPLMQKTINLLKRQAANKHIVLLDQSPAGLPINADAHHFEFIIRNLVSNAIKFTNEGGLVEINAEASKGMVVFSVKDNGIGVSKEKQLAFLKTTLPVSFGTKGEKGSGLGLLLIKEFVMANKGRIWLESEVGKGSVFYFSLSAATS